MKNIKSFMSGGGGGSGASQAEVDELRKVSANSGEALTAGEVGYLKSDGKIWLADASAEATSGPVVAGIITTTTAGADEATTLQIAGTYTTSGLTTGSEYYVSETAGAYTTTAPTADGTIVRVLGYALSTTEFLIGADQTWKSNGPDTVTINTQTGTTYTLQLVDASHAYVRMNNASSNVVTVPLNASVPFAVGSQINIRQEGAGLTTVRGATGVTLNQTAEAGGNESDVNSAGQFKVLVLVKVGTDAWDVNGGA